MEQFVIIVAGGSGKRMNSDIPKQFLLLNEEPVLMKTIRIFYEYSHEIILIVVLPAGQIRYWKTLCKKHQFTIPHTLVSGGETRHQSVKNGMEKIPHGSLVAVHDGVRPLVSTALIRKCFDTAGILGNAVPAIEITESVRYLEGEKSTAIDRSGLRLVQTPQVFRSDQLIEAFGQKYDTVFTDEATLVESAGYRINLVAGQPDNIKITTPIDISVASSLLDNR